MQIPISIIVIALAAIVDIVIGETHTVHFEN